MLLVVEDGLRSGINDTVGCFQVLMHDEADNKLWCFKAPLFSPILSVLSEGERISSIRGLSRSNGRLRDNPFIP